MRDKYLPIGSVVLLKGGKKRAMITGFCSVAQEKQDKIFFTGFEDDEEFEFKEKLNRIVSTLNNESHETLSISAYNGSSKSETLDESTNDIEVFDDGSNSSDNSEIKPFAGL